MPEIIGFFGSYPADICMYTAYAVQNAGKSVCVIDDSEDGILYQCVPSPNDQLMAVTYHEVDFMRLVPVVQWHELEYDYVLVQLGSQPQELCLALCSKRVLVVDCDRRNLDFYQYFIQESGLSAAVLLRGFCSEFAAKKIKKYLQWEDCLVERWMLLPFDEADEEYRIGMQYEPVYKFAHISVGMEHILVQLLRMFAVLDRVHTIRAVRNAKQGKTAAVSYRHLESDPAYREAIFNGRMRNSSRVI